MNNILPVVIFAAISILLWVLYFMLRGSYSKQIPLNFKSIAEKYGLVYDDSNRIGSKIYPLLKGVYKNRQSAIGCLAGGENKKVPQTYIRVECSNPRKLDLQLRAKEKNKPPVPGESYVNMLDSEFDEKFIVISNFPSLVFPIFTFNIKYSLVQAQHLGIKGKLVLNGNLIDYQEPGLMKTENSRTRIELLLHIMCDIADEMEKQS